MTTLASGSRGFRSLTSLQVYAKDFAATTVLLCSTILLLVLPPPLKDVLPYRAESSGPHRGRQHTSAAEEPDLGDEPLIRRKLRLHDV